MKIFRSAAYGSAIAICAMAATAASRPSQLPLRVQPAAPAADGKAAPLRQTRFDRFIVQYREGAGDASVVSTHLTRTARQAGVSAASGKPVTIRQVRRTALGGHVVASSTPLDRVQADRFLAQLRSDPRVAWAQPDYIKRPLETVPTDPHYADLQWDMHDPVGGVNAPPAWDLTAGEGTIVAVIDTGAVRHADLSANILPGYDFVSWYGQEIDGVLYPDIAGDGDGRDADASDPGDWTDASMAEWCPVISNSSWHGTHVAGTIAAVANNGVGVAGLAYRAKVQPVRVMGHCGGLTSDIVDAIVWASGGSVEGVPDNPTPAEVLNMSLGANIPCSMDPATQAAIDAALGRGVSVVVAAGNSRQNASGHSPASCSGVVTVGATDVYGAITYYSNYGASVSIAAPGGGAYDPIETGYIWSTGNSGTTVPVPSPEGDVMLGMVGTSMASPHVAAIAAMMQSAAVANGHPPLTPSQVKALLKGTATPFGVPPSPTTPIGTGIVDAAAAVSAAAKGYDERDIALPLTNRVPFSGAGGEAGENVFFKFTVEAGARSLTLRSYGGVGDVSLWVARERIPTAEDYDGRSQQPGNTESVTLANPAAGTYYLRLGGTASYRNLSVVAVGQ